MQILHEPTSPPGILEVASDDEYDAADDQHSNDSEGEALNTKNQGASAQDHSTEGEGFNITNQGASKQDHNTTEGMPERKHDVPDSTRNTLLEGNENEDSPHDTPVTEHPRYQLCPRPKTNYEPGFVYCGNYQAFQATDDSLNTTNDLSLHAYPLFQTEHAIDAKPMDIYRTIVHVCFTQMRWRKEYASSDKVQSMLC